jgi:flagellar capping protein FliD
VEFYGASDKYTTAGTYDVEVTVAAGAITSARMKLSTEATYRNAAISGNIVTGATTFSDHGDPVNPEHSLQLSVDLSQNGTFTATVNIKQGFAGAMVSALDRMLKASSGTLQLDQKQVDGQIDRLQDQMDRENERLTRTEDRLVAKFARLEKTLSMLQNQMAALGIK